MRVAWLFVCLALGVSADFVLQGTIDPTAASSTLASLYPPSPYTLGPGNDGILKNIQLSQPIVKAGAVSVKFPRGSFDFWYSCSFGSFVYSNQTGWLRQPSTHSILGNCADSFYPTSLAQTLAQNPATHTAMSGNGLVLVVTSSAGYSIYTKDQDADAEWNQTFQTNFTDGVVHSHAAVSLDGVVLAVSRVYGASANTSAVDILFPNGTLIQTLEQAAGTAFGSSLLLSGDGTFLLVGCPNQTVNGLMVGAIQWYQYINNTVGYQYVIGINPPVASWQRFGASMALSGDLTRLVVGAPAYQNSIGRTYLINFNWTNLTASPTAVLDMTTSALGYSKFGTSVATSQTGCVAAIGGESASCDQDEYPSGAVWIWNCKNDPSDISLVQLICFPRNSNYTYPKQIGKSVALSADGTTLAIGAPGYTSGGKISIFTRPNNKPTSMFAWKTDLYPATVVPGQPIGIDLDISFDGSVVVSGPYVYT